MPDVLAWLDLETSDTDETKGHSAILEVGISFTDLNLDPIMDVQLVINPSLDLSKRRYIDENDVGCELSESDALMAIFASMDPVVQKMHTDNGLWDAVRTSEFSTARADELLNEMVQDVAGGKAIALAGSGVGHFDSRWLRKFLPKTFACFEFAPYDVGSIRRFLRDIAGIDVTAADPHGASSGDAKKHRALDDARAHAEEARAYVRAFQELDL